MEKLERLRTIIVTGEAGIGKSTLAEQIALQYALKDFELCCIADGVAEAESVWTRDTKQFFYFDDFLGRNYLLALNAHEDSHIVALIKRIRNNPLKRFILTSRTTILNQGKSLTDLFRIENIERNEYELNVKKLALIDKGRILYNHIWHGDLASEFVEEFYNESRYIKVAKHTNFNPRLISFITDCHKIGMMSPIEYWSYVEDTLKNPKDIWSHVFDRQLDDATRSLVCLTVYNGTYISEALLMEAFARYQSGLGNFGGQFDNFQSAIRLAVGSVLNRTCDGPEKSVTLNLFNPSLGDYVTSRYKMSSADISAFLLALQTEFSLRNLDALRHNAIISKQIFLDVTAFLAERLLNSPGLDDAYRLRLAILCRNRDEVLPSLRKFILWIVDKLDLSSCPDDQADLLSYAIETGVIDPASGPLVMKIEALLQGEALDQEGFRAVSYLVKLLTGSAKGLLTQQFKMSFVNSWVGKINDAIYEDGALDDFVHDDEMPEAKAALKKFVKDQVEDIHLQLSQQEMDEIVDACNIDEIIDGNRNRRWSTLETPKLPTSNPVSDDEAAIHDLFDRGES